MTEFGHWMDQNRSEPGQKYFFLQLTRELGVKSNRYNQSKTSDPSHSLIWLPSFKIKKQSIKPISDDKIQLWKKKEGERERYYITFIYFVYILFICPLTPSVSAMAQAIQRGHEAYVAMWQTDLKSRLSFSKASIYCLNALVQIS